MAEKVFHVGPGDLKPPDEPVIDTAQGCFRCGGTRWVLIEREHVLQHRRRMRCLGCGWIRRGSDKYGDTTP